MAKIKESEILYVMVTMYRAPESAKPAYPVKWVVRVGGREHREFASYGKEFYKYEYPVEKLPKAVQAYVAKSNFNALFVNEGLKEFRLNV